VRSVAATPPLPSGTDPVAVLACIEDLRRVAQTRVPRIFYDYADYGSWTETTYRANETKPSRVRLRQRVAVEAASCSLPTQMIGQNVPMPIALAPTGLTGMSSRTEKSWRRGRPSALSMPSFAAATPGRSRRSTCPQTPWPRS
jgi:isopentenyl diphosphate isomerase/L-lactate dehydrogenase-like FMN-dependent dehydrogenase